MRIINASETGTLVLGFQGEDQRLEIRFPLVDEKTGRNITEEFPGGSFSISIMLPGDPAEHIVGSEDFRIEGNWLIWTVKEAYTVGFGEGKLQLNYAFGGMAKSRIWKTNVRKSINSGSGTVPSWSDWKTELLNAAAAVQSAVDSYDEMAAEAEELPAGSTPTAEMDHTGEHPVLKLGIPASQGGGGADIDDSTTASNKTWSSQKISSELSGKQNTLTFDSTPTEDSNNPVKSGGVYSALAKQSETIVDLKSALVSYKEASVTKDIWNNISWTEDYYVAKNGTATASTTYKYSNKIPVSPGDVLKFAETPYGYMMRFIAVYSDEDTVDSDKGSNNGVSTFTIPSGIHFIVISVNKAYPNTAVLNHTYKQEVMVNNLEDDVDVLYQILMNAEPNRFISNFDVSAGNTYTSDKELQDVCGYRICFFAKVGTFTGITRIGKAETQTYGGAIGFDGTNLYEYLGNISTASRTQAHGLTIKDYVGLVIDLHYDGSTVATLSTNGGSYTWTIPYWRSQYGQITVYSDSALSDCVLSYTCEGISKETWLYGDSYFANTGNIRWTAYLISKGYSNFLLNAYPGRNSETALASLKTDLELGKVPKRIVWCLGMNDKDSSSAPNTSWKSALDEVIEICDEYNIELVLATIPNVTSTSCLNTYKNAYVKASGYRYIPFAEAISADESSTWYDGMLDDGVHPTEQGALCLFNCAVSAVPELLW